MVVEQRWTAAALIVLITALAAVAVSAQRPASPIGPRDVRPETRGTATLRGRVIVDGTSSPVRGATVRAIPVSAGEVVTTSATEEGWFEFTGLATGRWRLEVEKGGFLPGRLGQRTVAGPGTTVTLAPGETVSVGIPLVKGAVIAGQLLDDVGEPAVAARVQAMHWKTMEGRRVLVPAGEDQTDDTGAFRIHSLPPGDYVVMGRGGVSPSTNAVVHVDASGRSNVMIVGHPAAEAEWFGARAAAPTYFPGTVAAGDAQRVTLRRGEERAGISFALAVTRVARVSGTIVSSTGTPISGQITASLVDPSGQWGPGPVAPGSRRTDGTFEMRDVPPGAYLLVAANGSFPAVQTEFATLPIVVSGEDITGLTVVTRPGGSVKGTVTGDRDTKPDTKDMGVYARPLLRGAFPLVDIGAPVREGSFEIANIAATSKLQIDRLPPGWALKSITVGGVDVTDTPIDFASGQQVNATIVLTNRLTRLAGVVTDAGAAAEAATVIVFPADPARWAYPSRFIATARSDDSGNFTLAALPPLENYLAAAVDEFESGMEHDPVFLERLRRGAAPLSLAEGESKRLDLAIAER